MIGSSSLSGDTLIACHFPVVPLPTWQLPVQALCGSAKRSGRLCTAGLTRAVSLPERESVSREQAFAGGRRPFSSSYGSLNEERAEEEGTSDSSGRYDSTSSPEETSSDQKKENAGARGSVRSHNSFLPSTELDEEDEDIDGDNLHRYREDSSFVLHGNANWPLSDGARSSSTPQGDLDSECVYDGTKSDQDWLSNPNPYQLADSPHTDYHTDYGEQDSDRLKDNVTRCLHSPHGGSQALLSNTEDISDSSCNSSDGVLVNFCTMYNRSNNPVTPHDLSSPALDRSRSCEGSVFLNLQPVRLTPTEDAQHDDVTVSSPQEELVDVTPSASCWSPRGLDSNCNLHSLEPIPPGLSSLEVSDLTACLQTQTAMAMETNQKYYKLVTCDLPSQSPSPAWSSLTSCPEGQSRGSHIPLSEHVLNHYNQEDKVDRLKGKLFSSPQCGSGLDGSPCQTYEDQVATTSTDQALCRKKCTAVYSSHCQDMCGVSTQPSVSSNQEHSAADSTGKGTYSLENGVVRYSKAQRPTSLPIQPFVLSPAAKSQSQTQHLGCLLEQYINQKSSKSKSFRPGVNGRSKTSLCFSNLQPSPMGSYCPILLEAPSSTDTCSTCTPSPECFSRRRTWCQFTRSQERLSRCTSKSSLDSSHCSPNPRPVQVQDSRNPGKTQSNYLFNLPSVINQSNLVKIPTYQNLINLSPEQSSHKPHTLRDFHSHISYQSILSHPPTILPVTADLHRQAPHVSSSPPTFSPSEEERFPQHGAAPAVHSGCFHSGVAAALSSVAPLSSLSSLLSLAASGLHVQGIQDSVGPCGKHSPSQHNEALMPGDRPPTEFCLSPDTSYESLSISHLQRRGLLRSVSRAVDLIMAHFGSSRDPEEKMRLGNSSCSPTIAGLVLKHLCPTIQRILEDGLKDHNLDLIIGQRRNHCWTVVEVSTRITSSSTKVLHSLVLKIQQCPHLTSHCMRLRAFLIGLLNLRGLEFWLSLLHSQKNVVTTYYHSWGFLSMSLGRCQPLFQELLLLLQPLSMLPFDLNLLLEPRLLCNRQLFPEEPRVSPPEPCSAFLVTSWPQLRVGRKMERYHNSQQTTSQQNGLHCTETLSPPDSSCSSWHRGGLQDNRSPWLASVPECWQKEPDLMDGVAEGEDCSLVCTDNWSQISMSTGQEVTGSDRDSGSPHVSTCVQVDSPCQRGPRWAKLFGAAVTSTRAEAVSQRFVGATTRRRPSEWLHLDRSQLGLLAQSIKAMKLVGSPKNY